MLKIVNNFLDWKFLSLTLYLFAFSQALVSYFVGDNSWFSAYGAVVGIFGLLLTVKHSVLKQSIDLDSRPHQIDTTGTLAEIFETTDEYKERKRGELVIQSKLEGKGVWLSVLEAAIWAYGFILPVSAVCA